MTYVYTIQTPTTPAYRPQTAVQKTTTLYLPHGSEKPSSLWPGFPEDRIAPEVDAHHDGRFSFWTAAKEFGKGLIRPIVNMARHPLLTLGALAAGAVLATAAPVTIPLMILGGALYGGYQTVRGIDKTLVSLKEGDYDAAEKAFGDIGEGTFALATSAWGLKAGGSIAAEAKATTSALKTATTAEERLQAIQKGLDAALAVRKGTFWNAFKESGSLLTSAEGRAATWSQLKPQPLLSNSKAVVNDFISLFKAPKVVDMEALTKSAQKQLGIADADMPEISNKMLVTDPFGAKVPASPGAVAFVETTPNGPVLNFEPDGLTHMKNMLRQMVTRGSANEQTVARGDKLAAYLDKLPNVVKNVIRNVWSRKINPENVFTHELTHAGQFAQSNGLTRVQAEAALDPVKGNAFLKEMFLDNTKLAGESAPLLQGDALAQAETALIRNFQGALANGEKALIPFSPDKVRNYIATPTEVEARMEGANAAIRSAREAFKTGGAGLFQAQRQMRSFLAEQRLNGILTELNTLRGNTDQATRIAELETDLYNLIRLFDTSSATQMMVKQEAKLRRIVNFFQTLFPPKLGKESIPSILSAEPATI